MIEMPPSVLADGPSAYELVVSTISAAGTLLAVVVSVAVAIRTSRDRRKEVAARHQIEAAVALQARADKHASAVRVSAAWQGHPTGSFTAPDGFGFLNVVIENPSTRALLDVVAFVDLPAPPPSTENAVERVGTIAAAAEHTMSMNAYGGHDPFYRVGVILEFTDGWEDRWRREGDGTLQLIAERQITSSLSDDEVP